MTASQSHSQSEVAAPKSSIECLQIPGNGLAFLKKARFLKELGLVLLATCTASSLGFGTETSSVKIAILDDMSGPYSAINGSGNVLSAQMAIDDYGGNVLGHPIQLVSADDQNRPDVGLTIARHWIDLDGVTLITGLGNSAVALGVRNLTRERGIVDIVVGAASPDFTGKQCSPTGFHWIHDSRSLVAGVVHAVVAEDLRSWFFLTTDYTFGHGLERAASADVLREGGSVVGNATFPMNSTDFSSFILQAQSSQAKVVAIAAGGPDLVNIIKASDEFGLRKAGQTLAAFNFYPVDVDAVGIATAQGMLTSSAFFSGFDAATRKFTERFASHHGGIGPTPNQAGVYGAVKHYLEAVAKAGTVDGITIAQTMKTFPVNDFMSTNVDIRQDGRVMRDTYVLRVKAPKDVQFPYDYFYMVGKVPASEGFSPMSSGECQYVQAK